MPGMTNGLDINDPTVVAAFRSALLHQGIAALLIFAVLIVAWVAIREWRLPAAPGSERAAQVVPAEPLWRQVLRIGFGLLWVFDGILQAQPSMAVGLPSKIIEPGAASSPSWVQHLVNWAGTAWSYHPVQAGAAAVWIQVGIGLWLLFAARGPLSRLAGVASVGWGLVVFVFGESFGGIFGPGLSWLTGAPGAAAFYCVAGALVALPSRYWRGPLLGRLMLGGTGVFLTGMAVLQAWPGRGFWQGTLRGGPASLTSMVQSMASSSQPAALENLVTGFGSFVRAHGFAVNLTAVIALGVLGVVFTAAAVMGTPWAAESAGDSGAPRRQRLIGQRLIGQRLVGRWLIGWWLIGWWLIRGGIVGVAALCLADWVLVQDFGFFGGLGTDPNSMIPMALLAIAGYLALSRAPVTAGTPARELAETPAGELRPVTSARPRPGWRSRIKPATLSRSLAAAGARTVLSASAIGVIIIGAVPMAAAQASSSAAPILAEAIDGSSAPLDEPAPAFALTDQHGRQVSLASLHGKVILLTFLDPVCVTQCPLEAQEFRQASVLLGADARKVELVAVNLNPLYSSTAYTQAFDRAERMSGVRDWLFLTGSPAQLRPVWRKYGQASQTLPAGSMLGHSDTAFVIAPSGRMREELNFDPGPGTTATESSFATELATAARQALGPR
jgi:cytochrome oxidase Cu insertion factor (SCO1/SenC/PrrC family)